MINLENFYVSDNMPIIDWFLKHDVYWKEIALFFFVHVFMIFDNFLNEYLLFLEIRI